MADVRLQHVRPLIKNLGDAWYADESAIMEAIRERSSFNLIHLDTAMKVDVFIPKLRRFDASEFTRSMLITLSETPKVEARVCCAEDIVIAKLEWYHLSGQNSDRQWGDILGVLRLNQGDLDHELLRSNADDLGITDLLQRAISEV
jgi:hypothetical protein